MKFVCKSAIEGVSKSSYRSVTESGYGRVILRTRRGVTNVGQAVPGGVFGRTTGSLAGAFGRLALFQSIGWVPGDNLAYVAGSQSWRPNSVDPAMVGAGSLTQGPRLAKN